MRPATNLPAKFLLIFVCRLENNKPSTEIAMSHAVATIGMCVKNEQKGANVGYFAMVVALSQNKEGSCVSASVHECAPIT